MIVHLNPVEMVVHANKVHLHSNVDVQVHIEENNANLSQVLHVSTIYFQINPYVNLIDILQHPVIAIHATMVVHALFREVAILAHVLQVILEIYVNQIFDQVDRTFCMCLRSILSVFL